MSKVNVDTIEPQSASTLTLGASGDTVTIPSGATIDASAATATGFGKVLQVLVANYSTEQTLATATYTDSGLSQAITPSSSSNKILCIWNMQAALGDDQGFGVKLLRDTTAIYTSADLKDVGNFYGWTYSGGVTHPADWGSLSITQSTNQRGHWMHLDSPSTTSSVTYKIQVGSYSGNSITLNESDNATQLTLMEISA